MACDGQGVVQGGSFGSGMGADGESSACQGYVSVDPFDLVVVEAVCRGGEDPRNLMPLPESMFGCGQQRVVWGYSGTGFDCHEPHVYFFEYHF